VSQTDKDKLLELEREFRERVLESLDSIKKEQDHTRTCVKELEAKFDLHSQKVDYELKEINRTNQIQNDILDEHHKRSDQLERDNDLREASLKAGITNLEARLLELEKPALALSWLKSAAMWVTAIVAGILALDKFFGLF